MSDETREQEWEPQKCPHGVVMGYGYQCAGCDEWYRSRGLVLADRTTSEARRGVKEVEP